MKCINGGFMKLEAIINILKEKNLLVEYDISSDVFTSVCYDSRKVTSNSIFVCKGLNFKKEYLLDVIDKGVKAYISEIDYGVGISKIIVKDVLKAMAIVSEAIYDDKNKDITLIGVTGTKGKTTIVDFIRNVLDESTAKKNAYWATIDHYSGKRYGASHNTTPESVDIYEVIKDAKDESLPYMTMEVSSQAVKMDRIYGLMFDVGVFINISYDHVSPLEHKDFDEYLACKIGFLKQCRTVFLYRHTDYYDFIRKQLEGQMVFTFGSCDDCDYIISDIVKENDSTWFTVANNGDVKRYQISIAGNFNVINATAAIAVATYLNVDYKSIFLGLNKTKVLGRMSLYQGDKCPIIVDYAHNKISVDALMRAIKNDYPDKNIKLVFGCPGDRGINRRKDVGELAGIYASYIYLTAEDPQTKSVIDICSEIISYIKPYNKPYEVIVDREEAIKKCISDATEDDVVLIIGKGDETYQIVNYEYVPYKSDIKVVEEIINLVEVK